MSRFKGPILCMVLVLCAGVLFSDSGSMSVQVKEGQLRKTPSFLAPIVTAASYGENVIVLQRNNGWMEVRTSRGAQGWIHESALSEKQIALSAGSKDARVKASGREVALAGKGFNAQVEAEFKGRHGNLDFASVDRMERIRVSAMQMQEFLKTGQLKPAKGGVK